VPHSPCRTPRAIRAASVPRPARQRGDHSDSGDLADDTVFRIRHINIAAGIHGDSTGEVEKCRATRAIRTAVIPSTTCKRGDNSSSGNFSDVGIEQVGYIDVANGIHRDAIRRAKLCTTPRAICAATTIADRSSQRGEVVLLRMNRARDAEDEDGDDDSVDGNAVFKSGDALLEKFVVSVLHADGFTMRIN
jgi:hypothetical protein